MITSITLEEAIVKAEEADACQKEIDIIKKFNSWEEVVEHEKAAYWFHWYARNVIKDRWIEAEEYIKKNPRWAYYYAQDVIKDRWIEAEEYIMKDPHWAYCYAQYVIKDRWIEAEEYYERSIFVL